MRLCVTSDFDQYDFTALMLAAMNGHVEIVQLLINAGASVNDKEKHVQNHCSFSIFFCQTKHITYKQ